MNFRLLLLNILLLSTFVFAQNRKVYVDTLKIWDGSGTTISDYNTVPFNSSGQLQTTGIADSSITSAKIATKTITSGNIGTGAVTTTGILDGTISYQDLNSSVQSLIGGQLYDYQDASINQKLQLLSRWADYLHDRYYNESDYYYHGFYDESGTEYLQSRRALTEYISLNVARHKITGKSIYWNKLTSLVSQALASCNTIYHETTAGRYTYTLEIEEGTDNFAHNDVPLMLAVYYIYTVDPVNYANYLTIFKDFIDVAYSHITKNMPGWGWAYYWDQTASVSTIRINVEFPWLPFWATVKKNNITTTDITNIATVDTLLDSLHYLIDQAWVHHVSYGGEDVGGWSLLIPDNEGAYADIDFDYNTSQASYWEAIEILQDTAFVGPGLIDTLQYATNYYSNNVGTNYTYLRDVNNLRTAFILKEAEKWGLTFSSSMFKQNWTATCLYPGSFIGDSWQGGAPLDYPRISLVRFFRDLALLIEYFNDNDYTDDYIRPFVSTVSPVWGTHATNFYTVDGYLINQRYWLGQSNSNISLMVGYNNNDATPGCQDTSLWTIDNDKILSWSYPAMSNGVAYTVKKRLGSPMMLITPSKEDSIALEFTATGNVIGDSIYIYYYDQNSILQSIRAASISVGDSITGIRGNYGVIAGAYWNPGSVTDKVNVGFICNESNMTLIKRYDSRNGRQVFMTSIQTLPDSAIVYINKNTFTGLLKNIDPDYGNLIIKDYLEMAKRYWDYGLDDKGIITSKVNQ